MGAGSNKNKDSQNEAVRNQAERDPVEQSNNNEQDVCAEDEEYEESWSDEHISDQQYDPYEYDSEDEGISDYKPGGYPPLHIGEILHNRYVLVKKVGWGHFSTVWLARDFKNDSYVALKILKSAPHYIQCAFEQIQILQKLHRLKSDQEWNRLMGKYPTKKDCGDNNHILTLLNCFVYKSVYGKHFCFVFEMLGENLRQIMRHQHYHGISPSICKKIIKQVLKGLDYMHSVCGIIHTDLKPDNILVALSDKQKSMLMKKGIVGDDKHLKDKAKEYRKAYGFEVDSSFEDDDAFEHIDKSNMTKTQKKNLRKRMKKLKQRKKKEKAEQKKMKEQKTGLSALFEDEKKKPKKQHIPIDHMFTHSKQYPEPLTEDTEIKIADLGNACWKHHHFSRLIQTREYRAPEVVMGMAYSSSADIWSAGCILYEMLTGEVLFELGQNMYQSRNFLHLASIQEKLGTLPKILRTIGAKSKHYFGVEGKELKGIRDIPYLPISKLIIHKQYLSISDILRLKMKKNEAELVEDLLLKMLDPRNHRRITAREALAHPWLKETDNYRWKMQKLDYQNYLIDEEEELEEGEQGYIPRNLGVQSSDYEADQEQADSENQEDEDDGDTKRWKQGVRRVDNVRLLDQSFTDLGYIGYSEGISLEELDLLNWQFV